MRIINLIVVGETTQYYMGVDDYEIENAIYKGAGTTVHLIFTEIEGL